MEVRCRLPFGDISGAIDANKEERNTARIGPLQRAKPMADRFKADTEAISQQFDIVTPAFSLTQEDRVRQNHCAGEIVGETDASQPPRLVVGETGLIDDRPQFVVELQNGDLCGELKRLLPRPQPPRQLHDFRACVELALRTRWRFIERVKRHLHAVPFLQISSKRGCHLPDGEFHPQGDRFGGFIQLRNMVVVRIKEVTHLFERRRGQNSRCSLAVLAKPCRQHCALFNCLPVFPAECNERTANRWHVQRKFAQIRGRDGFTDCRISQRFT